MNSSIRWYKSGQFPQPRSRMTCIGFHFGSNHLPVPSVFPKQHLGCVDLSRLTSLSSGMSKVSFRAFAPNTGNMIRTLLVTKWPLCPIAGFLHADLSGAGAGSCAAAARGVLMATRALRLLSGRHQPTGAAGFLLGRRKSGSEQDWVRLVAF